MKLIRTRPRLQHARRAALTVEMALTLPIFFMILFGGLEMVRVNMLRNGLENAAFEGARRGSLPGSTSAAAPAPIASFSRTLRNRSSFDGGSALRPVVIDAPPRTRRNHPSAARTERSRFIVDADVSRTSANSTIDAERRCRSISRMRCCLSAGSTLFSSAIV